MTRIDDFRLTHESDITGQLNRYHFSTDRHESANSYETSQNCRVTSHHSPENLGRMITLRVVCEVQRSWRRRPRPPTRFRRHVAAPTATPAITAVKNLYKRQEVKMTQSLFPSRFIFFLQRPTPPLSLRPREALDRRGKSRPHRSCHGWFVLILSDGGGGGIRHGNLASLIAHGGAAPGA